MTCGARSSSRRETVSQRRTSALACGVPRTTAGLRPSSPSDLRRGDPDLRSPRADRASRLGPRARGRRHPRLGHPLRTVLLRLHVHSGRTRSDPRPQVCRGSSLVEIQGSDLFPAPLLWILMWSLAPLLAVLGVWLSRRPRIRLIALALLMELTGVISLGGGFIFALVIEPLLLITLIASLHARPQMG